jgi:UDP-glucose 4-epimerase
MTRVLITGGHGYIGGRLVQALAPDNKFSVTVAGRRARAALPGIKNVTIDWVDQESVVSVCRNQDVVVHLAAMNESDCEKNPEQALQSNGLATLSLVTAAHSTNVCRFLYVSTAKVFGPNPTGCIDEASLPHPANHYAITHRVAEDYVLAAHQKQLVQGVVLRLTNSVGAPVDPNTDAWMVIANDLCRQAATTGRIVLRSSGLAWRNFICMTDVVSALCHVIMMPTELLADGLFHLGGPDPLRIWDLALRICDRAEKLFKRPMQHERVSPQAGEYHSLLDWRIDKLKSTGWAPTASFDDEIDSTLRMCSARLSIS